jgi:hypothetical protein
VFALGALLVVTAGCSSNKANRESEQNAKLWGQASCSIVEAQSATDQQNAFGQTQLYSSTAVQQIAGMQQGAQQINTLNAQLNSDKTAGSVTKYVPDLTAIQNKAASLAKGSSGDEGDAWNSLSGALADCIAQLPKNLQ